MRRLALLAIIAFFCASSLYLCGCQRPAAASTEPAANPIPDWTPFFFVGRVGDISVSIVEVRSEERPFRVLVTRGGKDTLYDCYSAEILPDGTVLMTDLLTGLVALRPDGEQETLLKAGEIGGLVQLDPSSRLLAFNCPVEYSGECVLKDGIAVYDIQTGEHRLLYYEDPPGFAKPLGWLDQSVVFCGPDISVILRVDLKGSESVLTTLPGKVHQLLPMKGDLLAYEILDGGVGVVNLRTLDSPQVFPDATSACWTEAGLEVVVEGERKTVVSADGDR